MYVHTYIHTYIHRKQSQGCIHTYIHVIQEIISLHWTFVVHSYTASFWGEYVPRISWRACVCVCVCKIYQRKHGCVILTYIFAHDTYVFTHYTYMFAFVVHLYSVILARIMSKNWLARHQNFLPILSGTLWVHACLECVNMYVYCVNTVNTYV